MNTREYFDLTSHEMEAMMFMVENSLKVYKRFQFFLWAQGGLHRFIPHETLICARGDVGANRFQFEVFSQNAEHEKLVHELVDPVDGLLPKLVAEWRRRGAAPFLLAESEGESWSHALTSQLRRYGFGHALAHGAKEMNGDSGSFFLFLNLPNSPTSRDAHMSELLMPYMHMALHRMVANETDAGTQSIFAEAVLSGRELEVLGWVRDGKTNHEIAQILEISPLTVKNHVQKILRKLNATNRAQAVAKGIGSNLFTSGEALVPPGP